MQKHVILHKKNYHEIIIFNSPESRTHFNNDNWNPNQQVCVQIFNAHLFLFKNEGGDSTWYIRKLVEKLSKVLFSVINWKLAIHTYLLVVSKKQKKQQIYHSCYNILLKCYSSLWLIQKTFEPFINNVLLKFHK